jgi:hypothetical protein
MSKGRIKEIKKLRKVRMVNIPSVIAAGGGEFWVNWADSIDLLFPWPLPLCRFSLYGAAFMLFLLSGYLDSGKNVSNSLRNFCKEQSGFFVRRRIFRGSLQLRNKIKVFHFKGRWSGVKEHKDSLCPSLLKIKTTIILPMLNTNMKR